MSQITIDYSTVAMRFSNRIVTSWRKIRKRIGKFTKNVDSKKKYFQEVTLHGLVYLTKPEHSKFRCLWFLILAGMMIANLILVLAIWRRYNAQAMKMTVRSFHVPSGSYEFPSVTVCSTKKDRVKAFKLLNSLKYTDGFGPEDVLQESHALVYSFLHWQVDNRVNDRVRKIGKILQANKISIRKFVESTTQPCDDIFGRCRWMGATVPCHDLFENKFMIYGFCCTFDSRRQINQSGGLGPNTGLTLIAPNIERLFVAVHRPNETVLGSKDDILRYSFVHPGLVMHAQYLLTVKSVSEEVLELPVERRSCALPQEVHLKYFKEYRRSFCIAECSTNVSLSLCGCAKYNSPVEDDKVCAIEDVSCLNSHRDVIYSNKLVSPGAPDDDDDEDDEEDETHHEEEIDGCDCWDMCFQNVYDVEFDVREMNAIRFNTDPFYESVDENKDAVIHVYSASQVATDWRIVSMDNWINLLYSLGGVFGLCLGCSCITIVELIFLCVKHVIIRQYKAWRDQYRYNMELIMK